MLTDVGSIRTDSVQGDILAHTITLTTRPVEWQHFGKSCHVKYDYNGRNTVDVSDQLNLQRRQTVVDDNTYSIGVTPDLSRIPLYPPNATLAPNASAEYVLVRLPRHARLLTVVMLLL